jgi:hypothetical protein
MPKGLSESLIWKTGNTMAKNNDLQNTKQKTKE